MPNIFFSCEQNKFRNDDLWLPRPQKRRRNKSRIFDDDEEIKSSFLKLPTKQDCCSSWTSFQVLVVGCSRKASGKRSTLHAWTNTTRPRWNVTRVGNKSNAVKPFLVKLSVFYNPLFLPSYIFAHFKSMIGSHTVQTIIRRNQLNNEAQPH